MKGTSSLLLRMLGLIFFGVHLAQTGLAQNGDDTQCKQDLQNFLTGPALQSCGSCHAKSSASGAPQWMGSDEAFAKIWESSLTINVSGSDNILLAKSQSPTVTHGGGKIFDPTGIESMKVELTKLIEGNCLKTVAASIRSNVLQPMAPLYTNLRKRFVALVGEDSRAVSEISKYAIQLGAYDYKVSPSSRLNLNPANASILGQIVQFACTEIVSRRAWVKVEPRFWVKTLAEFIVEVTSLPIGNAYREAHWIEDQFVNYAPYDKSLLSCSVVLRSERFLLP